MVLRGNSHLEALDILVACGASKMVDEVIKVKKNPITPFEVLKEAIGSLLEHHGLTLDLLDQLPTRLYLYLLFSPQTFEKLRVGRFECRDQVIVDLFAGIGYSTLPLLVRANAKMVYACEWNPHAIEALRRNLDANNVADRCVILEGDNRVTAPKGVADRVSSGLLPSSKCSYLTVVRALRDEVGILQIIKSEGRSWEVSVEHVERVKWYAPHTRHLVIDMRCKVSND